MLKIKDSFFNKDEIRFILPFNSRLLGYCIDVELKNDMCFYIDFNTKLERDTELNKISEKVSDDNGDLYVNYVEDLKQRK